MPRPRTAGGDRGDLVIVESPAKAKTIERYLGPGYRVLASYGHVRDLPAKDGSVLPDADFAMSWEVDGKSEKHMKEIAAAVRQPETAKRLQDLGAEPSGSLPAEQEAILKRQVEQFRPIIREMRIEN